MSYYTQDLLLKLENENTTLKAKLAQQKAILADRFNGRKLPDEPISEIMESSDIVEQPGSASLSKDDYTLNQINAKPQRITEQDARELFDSFVMKLDDEDLNEWLESEGRTLLAKLNEHREPDYKVRTDELLQAAKQKVKDMFLEGRYEADEILNDIFNSGTRPTEDAAGILIRPQIKLE